MSKKKQNKICFPEKKRKCLRKIFGRFCRYEDEDDIFENTNLDSDSDSDTYG